MSDFDDKWYILDDGINTLPYGHKDTLKLNKVKISYYVILMNDIKFATYPYTPIKNVKDEQILEIVLSNNDDKRLKHKHMEQMLLKYVKVKC